MTEGRLNQEEWLHRVRRGEFDAVPNPFFWTQSIDLAHLIHGYDLAQEIGIGELGPFANAKVGIAEATGCWEGTATELWLCLFYEQRRARHIDCGDAEESVEGPQPFLDALCQALRLRLQVVGNQERALLMKWIARGSL
jgi:hypothetical protein